MPTPVSTPRDQIAAQFQRSPLPSMIELIDGLIGAAHEAHASDVHIDADPETVRIRFRIDGVMQDIYDLPKHLLSEVVTRIKILSHLRTDEHQAAQDGRFRSEIAGMPLDVRVSIVPSYHGESVVLRLLAQEAGQFTLDSLGFSDTNKELITRAIANPYGMILATGPTGSGKTTTLYAILKELNTQERSIITIEDPIEYAVGKIKQIPVNHRTGLTFASGLRSILRQDPDIIMVGEIRDEETAGLAVNTALTGHLLLSTLHTNDAATTLPRLLDMGIEPYLVSSTINIAIGQRLVRKICPDCRIEKTLSKKEYDSLVRSLNLAGTLDKKFYTGSGCGQCGNSGYRGRIGIHEVLVLNDRIKEAILTNASASVIKKLAVQDGMATLIQDGLAKAAQGITSLEEVLRVIHE
jgi:type II secretory ATPase GspE/PulE/Tfp pilus assembly ATPase PilB-like protein